VRRFEIVDGNPNCVAFSPDGRFCLSGTGSDGTRFSSNGKGDPTLQLWDVSTGECVRRFEGHEEEVTSVAFSPDGRFCVSVSMDGTLRFWNVLTGKCLGTLKGKRKGLTSVAFSPDGRHVLSGNNWDHTLRLWEVQLEQLENE